MKIFFAFLLAVLFTMASYGQTNVFPSTGSVGIGTTNPHPSSILEIKSFTQGILIPRMSMSQRNAISGPPVGLLIYQTDNNPGFYYFNGTTWSSVASQGGIIIDNAVFLTDGGAIADSNTFVGATFNSANSGTGNTFVGASAGKSNNTGSGNTFVGASAGQETGLGISNTFVGNSAGISNTSGGRNSFFGGNAGFYNVTGKKNCFFGCAAGMNNTSGFTNSFFGYKSGLHNTTADLNSFFGDESGNSNTTGEQNSFLGARAGDINTIGSFNVFVGHLAGGNNTTANNNCFLGHKAGQNISTGSNNTFIGANVSALSGDIFNSVAIGYNFSINQSNIIQLGNGSVTKIGIGKSPSTDDILDFQSTTAKLTTGGVWTNASDKKLKNNFENLDKAAILDKIQGLTIQRWHYISDPQSITHIGPYADEFYKLFGVGDDSTISTIDPSGIALIAIQALVEENNAKDKKITNLEASVDQLKSMMYELQQSVTLCCEGKETPGPDIHSSSAVKSDSWMYQNTPNPFIGSTSIKFHLAEAGKSAFINLCMIDGKELKRFNLKDYQTGEISITGDELSEGSYIYNLIIDGVIVDSKKLSIIR